MRLKTERKALLGGVGALAAVGLALSGMLWNESKATEVVKLGQGVASVEQQPIAAFEPRPQPAEAEPAPTASESPMKSGHASYYGNEFSGKRTASGEVFNPGELTAAHRTLPMGSRVRVTNPRSGDSIVVRINDRGPFHGNRVIDLSAAAARSIGLIRQGTGQVNLALLVR
ncbi:septal ring lytic transglycosylase RlpA family protein [Altererythrobacter sp. HHU K3-1]|uniref:Endolytic peptidoglycan transglycosylase RlpA n=2 Tax=Qipengyuania atrilutea TaxID=2744473 RepID=A0A850H6R9_9SPHN|nr:septal ring lytic transglycosylase RlpA family protein [Actirhodobacter atriluteus]